MRCNQSVKRGHLRGPWVVVTCCRYGCRRDGLHSSQCIKSEKSVRLHITTRLWPAAMTVQQKTPVLPPRLENTITGVCMCKYLELFILEHEYIENIIQYRLSTPKTSDKLVLCHQYNWTHLHPIFSIMQAEHRTECAGTFMALCRSCNKMYKE